MYLCQISQNTAQLPHGSARIPGIIPNYRIFLSLQDYQPLTIREKLKPTLLSGSFGVPCGIWRFRDRRLRQNPRHFRRGTGGGWSRLAYAMGPIFWTHTDSGGTQFNYSEVIGNSTAVAISQPYYADSRTASDAVSKLGTQLGFDMASNVPKEF